MSVPVCHGLMPPLPAKDGVCSALLSAPVVTLSHRDGEVDVPHHQGDTRLTNTAISSEVIEKQGDQCLPQFLGKQE